MYVIKEDGDPCLWIDGRKRRKINKPNIKLQHFFAEIDCLQRFINKKKRITLMLNRSQNGKPEKVLPQILYDQKNYGKWRLTAKDAALYALSIGFNLDPLNTKQFKYTFEKSKDFTVLPINVSTFGHQQQVQELTNHRFLPEYRMYSHFHIEENFYLLHDKIRIDTDYEIIGQFIDVIDKGKDKGCILVIKISGFYINERGQKELAFYSHRVTMHRTLGGCGFKTNGNYRPYLKRPQRNPDLIIKDGLFPSQVFFYRLNNAPNPIHIDPELAKEFGYPKPMVHGQLSYTTIVRVILQHVLDYDQTKLGEIHVRFTGLVFVADQFQIKIWKEGNKIFFETEVPDRQANVALGYIILKEGAKL